MEMGLGTGAGGEGVINVSGAGSRVVLSSHNDTVANVYAGGIGVGAANGGDGKDTYVFRRTSESAAGAARDLITDFDTAGGDVIHLSRIDAQASVGKNNAFSLTGNSGADDFTLGVEGQLRFFQTGGDTIVQLEVNGDGVADSEIQLSGLQSLDAGDFIL